MQKKKTKGFTGLYFMDEMTFFAIYPTENGPVMYYEGKEYALSKELHITLKHGGELQGMFEIWTAEENMRE